MEFLLVHVAGWPTIFADFNEGGQVTPFTADVAVYGDWAASEPWTPPLPEPATKKTFPKLMAWYPELLKMPVWRKVRSEILGFWVNEKHLDELQGDFWDGHIVTPKWLEVEEKPYRIARFPPIKRSIAEAKDEFQ